jgi:hypothetical protein
MAISTHTNIIKKGKEREREMEGDTNSNKKIKNKEGNDIGTNVHIHKYIL